MVKKQRSVRRRTARNSPHVVNHKAKRTLKLWNKPSTVQAVYTDANNMYMLKSHFHHVPCASCTLHWVGFSSTIGFTMKPATWSLVKIERGEAAFSPSTTFQTTPTSHILGWKSIRIGFKGLNEGTVIVPVVGQTAWVKLFHGCLGRYLGWPTWRIPGMFAPSPKRKPMWVEFL